MKTTYTKSISIKELLKLTYYECCRALKEKYGSVKGDYFLNGDYQKPNPEIKRSKDGLFIHHIDAYTIAGLSSGKKILEHNADLPAKPYPWESQKADRLIYCNFLEHLVLHIKIAQRDLPENRFNESKKYYTISKNFIPRLNDMYSGIKYNDIRDNYLNNVAEVLPNKWDYLLCLEEIMKSGILSFSDFLNSEKKSSVIKKETSGWDEAKNNDLCQEISLRCVYVIKKKNEKLKKENIALNNSISELKKEHAAEIKLLEKNNNDNLSNDIKRPLLEETSKKERYTFAKKMWLRLKETVKKNN